MNDRLADYLTDVEYTGNFYSALAPARLAYVAAINGYTPPRLDRPFSFCELGCGKGITSLVLAATYPNGDFHACDMNATHIEHGEALRRSADVTNLHFHAERIAEMLERPLPDFDCIALHGVYSWVPDTVRGEIRQFVRRRLKPGGLCMVSYNAMPGWAHLQPVRRMMQAYAQALPGDSLQKARAAFEYVSFLAEQGAAYFRTHPAAADHLKIVAHDDIRYVAHEYLTPHGDPFYFSEVEAAMRGIGLCFAGSMTFMNNYAALMVPRQFQDLLATAPDRLVLETHRDFIQNTAFRQDLYALWPPAVPPDDLALERLQGLAFCLTDLPERLPLQRTDGALRYDLSGCSDPVRSVHALLQRGPADACSIHRASGLPLEAQSTLLIQQLTVSEHIVPCPAVRRESGWMALNSALIEAALRDRLTRLPLACPRSGAAMSVEPVQAAIIESAARFECPEAAAASVLARLSGYPVTRSDEAGERSATDGEILEYAAAAWRGLRDAAGPDTRVLKLLGVLA